jgi:hypothetical protein
LETARRRLDALPLEAVVAQLAALEAGALLALVTYRKSSPPKTTSAPLLYSH